MMKYFAFLLFPIFTFSQKEVVNTIGEASGFCSNTFYFYSDSTFTFERGCESRSYVTIGDYKKIGNTFTVYPKDSNEIELISNLQFNDSDESNKLRFVIKTSDNEDYFPFVKFTSVELAEQWKNGTIDPGELNELDFVTIDSENGYQRIDSNSRLAVCMIDLTGLISARTYYIMEPKIDSISMNIGLPSSVMKFLVLYDVKYENLSSGEIKLQNQIIKVVNR